jgi:transcription elongation factor Elf1
MVVKKTNKKPVKPKQQPETKRCARCNTEKSVTQYYTSYDLDLNPDGKMAYCKQCLREMIINDRGEIDIDKVKETLRKIDRPFIQMYWDSALEDDKDTWGVYLKNIALNKKNATWEDSDGLSNITGIGTDYYDIDVTPEMIQRWGKNHSGEEYIILEQFYQDMKRANNIETPQDENYLKKLAMISLKMDEELEQGNYDEVKKLGDLYSKYMADSKFRAMDKTEADKTGGIRNFGQIWMECEKDDFIPPWEHYRKLKGIKQDIVDKSIMHIENFTLKLNKIEKMITPPIDTPKLDLDEIDDSVGE